MEFVRWYSWPIAIGFSLAIFLNPWPAVLGLLLWLAAVWYIARRCRYDLPDV